MSNSTEGLSESWPRAMLGSGRITMPKKLYPAVLAVVIFSAFFWFHSQRTLPPAIPELDFHNPNPVLSAAGVIIEPIAKYFIDYPLNGPDFAVAFGELGQRVQSLTRWAALSDLDPKDFLLRESVENVSLSMFPFLRNPTKPDDPTPVASLRRSYQRGSRGIVIPVGSKDFRYAYHLVLNIRTVLQSKLPIQVVYAGDDDLPSLMREKFLVMGEDINFLNILQILDNKSMGLGKDWAIKAFAVLASTFEQVILLDADSIFFKKPEVLFEQTGYKETGALFFHDRLLWQHGFQERHKWWKEQMEHQEPSETLLKSKVWMDDYAEEADSGVVVLDKSKLPVFMGLLHVGWQNMKIIREEVTYKMMYGDKESWWFGLELCSVHYAFEKHYGAVLGVLRSNDGKSDVCGFTIAHVDENDHLLWENGSLLKNKAVDKTEFQVPTHWMIDATWEKGATKADMSCMKDGLARELTPEESITIKRSVEGAPTNIASGTTRHFLYQLSDPITAPILLAKIFNNQIIPGCDNAVLIPFIGGRKHPDIGSRAGHEALAEDGEDGEDVDEPVTSIEVEAIVEKNSVAEEKGGLEPAVTRMVNRKGVSQISPLLCLQISN
ncbi:hypothetical protein EG329_010071 [Mollisiaceae sp. DMI_Dod_QoI]|nr:hypothetical protein EG329_010071 [Helotiales sp. DMI_Dod_QoI]